MRFEDDLFYFTDWKGDEQCVMLPHRILSIEPDGRDCKIVTEGGEWIAINYPHTHVMQLRELKKP